MSDERSGERILQELSEAAWGTEAASRLAPFQDFSTAARAVFGHLCQLEDVPIEDLVGRLLSTVLVAEERARDATDRADRAELDSLADPLTGLANRRAWIRLLATEEDRCRRHGIETSVVVIDLDALKEINDREGHAAGDDLLQRAARAIVGQTRSHDAVARLGGDEFGVLATHCPGPDARALTHRLVEALDRERISASVGASTRTPEQGLHRAWEHADSSMYRTKRRRKVSRTDESSLTQAHIRHTSTGHDAPDPFSP